MGERVVHNRMEKFEHCEDILATLSLHLWWWAYCVIFLRALKFCKCKVLSAAHFEIDEVQTQPDELKLLSLSLRSLVSLRYKKWGNWAETFMIITFFTPALHFRDYRICVPGKVFPWLTWTWVVLKVVDASGISNFTSPLATELLTSSETLQN